MNIEYFPHSEPANLEFQWERKTENLPEQQRSNHEGPLGDEALDHKAQSGQKILLQSYSLPGRGGNIK